MHFGWWIFDVVAVVSIGGWLWVLWGKVTALEAAVAAGVKAATTAVK